MVPPPCSRDPEGSSFHSESGIMGWHLILRALTDASEPTDPALGDMRIVMIDRRDKRWCRRMAGTRKSDGIIDSGHDAISKEWSYGRRMDLRSSCIMLTNTVLTTMSIKVVMNPLSACQRLLLKELALFHPSILNISHKAWRI